MSTLARLSGSSAVLALLCVARTLGAQAPLILVPVRVDRVMTRAEQQKTGVASLTPEQRLHFEGWLTRYWAELRQRVVPATQGLAAPPGAPLVAAPGDGAYVHLADGTLWEIYLPDRTFTEVWRRGDYVAVSRAAAGAGDYDHILANAPARMRAFARFVGLVPARRR